jgi:hypothetical protein
VLTGFEDFDEFTPGSDLFVQSFEGGQSGDIAWVILLSGAPSLYGTGQVLEDAFADLTEPAVDLGTSLKIVFQLHFGSKDFDQSAVVARFSIDFFEGTGCGQDEVWIRGVDFENATIDGLCACNIRKQVLMNEGDLHQDRSSDIGSDSKVSGLGENRSHTLMCSGPSTDFDESSPGMLVHRVEGNEIGKCFQRALVIR